MKVNIITNWQDHKGLWKDGCLLRSNLEAWGRQVEGIQFNSRFALPPHGPEADLNIFLETLRYEFFSLAPKQWWVPNPEWADLESLALARNIDRVLCKTREAFYLLAPHVANPIYVGWESEDRYDPLVERSLQVLHIAGGSILKGTQEVLETWERFQPKFPLIVVGEEQVIRPRQIFNVTYQLGRLEDKSLKRLQNASMIHLCPSEFEGWGHTIHEGLSVDALVITGALVKGVVCIRGKPYSQRQLARLSKVDVHSLGQYLEFLALQPSLRSLRTLNEGIPRGYFLSERLAHRVRLYALLEGSA